MTKPNYTFQKMDNDCAKAFGRNLPVSTKSSIEMCSFLRGKSYDNALKIVEGVITLKQAIPFRRFTDGVGHRKGKMGPGRYPVKLAQEMKALLNSAKSNAENKGLSDSLKIIHLVANKASTPFHQGRQRRRAMKRTHIELVLKEDEKAIKKQPVSKKKVTKVEEKSKKEDTKEELKTETKKMPEAEEKAQTEVKKETVNQQEKNENPKPASKEANKGEVKND